MPGLFCWTTVRMRGSRRSCSRQMAKVSGRGTWRSEKDDLMEIAAIVGEKNVDGFTDGERFREDGHHHRELDVA